MKKIFFLISTLAVLVTPALSAKWPSPGGAVNDFAQVIPTNQSQELENYLDDFQDKTGNAIVVATFPSVGGADVDRAAVELYQAWGIGQKGKDNGILILASIKDRRARIEVGYGLEDVVTDADAGDILRQHVYPYFKQQQYGQGLCNAAHALVELIAQKQKGQALGNQENGWGAGIGDVLKFILIFAVILLYLFLRIRFGWWGVGGLGGGGGWGGGGFGGGGGGFGGFGGGGSGGGGASGGW